MKTHPQHTERRLPLFATLFVMVFLLALYYSVIPSQLSAANNGSDGGDFLAAILTQGVPHPTGYPTYLLIGRLFQALPAGTPYYKGALVSILAAALAAGLTSLSAGLQFGKTPAARAVVILVSGLSLGTSALYWSQAVIVEVYGLQAFFIACAILWMQIIQQKGFSPGKDWALSLLAACAGLGVGNHITILLLLPAYLYSLYQARAAGYPARVLARYVGLSCLGLATYLYIPLLARNFPPINWEAAADLPGLTRLVSGEMYRGLVFGVTLPDILSRISSFANLLLESFGFLGLLAGIAGAVCAFSLKQPVKVIYAWIFFVYLVFSLGYSTNDSTAYLIPSLMIFSIWVGSSVETLFDVEIRKFPAGKLVIAILLVVCLVRIPLTRQAVDPRRDISAAVYAESTLQTLPPNAIVLTRSDTDTFPLWYYHFGLKYRPDITIIVLGLKDYPWYQQTLRHTYPGLTLPTTDAGNWEVQLGLENAGRTVCRSREETTALQDIQFECFILN